ncbi:MAG: sulfurtransferase TusA family protein [Planctomycetota bacterium]
MSQLLDCRGLKCPMSIVKISLALRDLSSGALLAVEATDPAFEANLRAWASMTGNTIESFERGSVLRASIRVA